MTKPRQLSPVMAAAPTGVCLKRLVAFRLKEILSYKKGAYEGSVDAIHDMRVSCRRLQSLFKVFKDHLHQKKAREFRRFLRKLLAALGAVREDDVLIGYIVGSVEPATPEQKVALGLLVGRYSLRRFQAHRSLHSVLSALDAKENSSFSAGWIGGLISTGGHPAVFRERLAEAIESLFGRFIEAGASVIGHPRQTDALHRLRIQGKPLRYTMELSTPFFGESFFRCYQEVKAAIELLGDIHDIDIALDRLKAYHEEIRLCNDAVERAPSRFSRLGPWFLQKAIRALRARRNELFFSMCATFGRWRTSRLQATLLTSIK